jgi:sulfonate transport system substrate-binding protein
MTPPAPATQGRRRSRSGLTLATTTAATALAATGLAACGSSVSANSASAQGGTPALGSSGANSSQPSAVVVAPASSTSGVTLVVGDQAGTGAETLLQASGLIKQLPFKVKWADFTSGPPMLQALTAGHVDIGGVGDAPPVFSAAGSSNLAIVGALKNGDSSAALVVPANSKITSVKQLAGKKVAVAEGSSGNYHLLTVLTKHGLTSKDIDEDNLQPAEGLSALQSGAVDAWDVWSPFIEEAQAKGDRILVGGKGYGAPYSYEVASKTALKNPKLVAAIKLYLKLLNQAHVWADTHSKQWGSVWAKATGLSDSIMDKAAADDKEVPIKVTSATVTSEQGLVTAFYTAGEIPKSYSFGPYVTTAFNGSVTAAK